MSKEDKTILVLIRIALSGVLPEDALIEADVDWTGVISKASDQGVLGVCFDALELLPVSQRPDMDNLMEWIGQTEYQVTQYQEHKKTIAELAHFYEGQGVKFMILKGYGLSLYYPKPEHRPVGDIDSYNFGLQKFADQMMHDKLRIEIDNSHHRHSVFKFHGTSVENHFDFIDDYTHRSNKRIEALLKDEVEKDCREVMVEGYRVFLPSVRFNSLFLLKHCAGHFAATEMTLRQLLDWLLFVKANSEKIDWRWLYDILRRENLNRYADCMNAIGVKYLGLDESIFPSIEKDKRLVKRVLNDILTPEFKEHEDGTLMSGLWIKPRRWWHNRWKHRICYADNLFVDFCMNVYSKMLKPSHFRF